MIKILKICLLFLQLPLEISNGSKKRTMIKIKRMMGTANLL
jgi:hypothetical protein